MSNYLTTFRAGEEEIEVFDETRGVNQKIMNCTKVINAIRAEHIPALGLTAIFIALTLIFGQWVNIVAIPCGLVFLVYLINNMTTKVKEDITTPLIQGVDRIVTEAVPQAMRTIRQQSNQDDELSLKEIINQSEKHKFGLAASVYTAYNAKSASSIGMELVKITSLLGVENQLYKSILSRLGGNLVDSVPIFNIANRFQQADERSYFPNSTWEQKRVLGLLGAGATALGLGVSNVDPLKFITKAQQNQQSLEKLWDSIEEYLNSLGVLNTGKYAYIKELNEQFLELKTDFDYFNELLAVSPAQVCRPSIFSRWTAFQSKVKRFEQILNRNTNASLKDTRLFMSFNTVILKVYQWHSTVLQIRSTNGIRPIPVGVGIYGESQLGKTTLYQELVRRVTSRLEVMAQNDPERWGSFIGARQWTTWSVQARDEFDQGYGGQELTYMDDGFADKEHKDHQMWLTFISGQAVGTVQADLQNKGLPFLSRMCAVSFNNFPEKSLKINNIEALHERFPITIGVSLKSGERKKKSTDNYDPDFKHLRLHVTGMRNHCCRPSGGCGGSPLNQGANCTSQDLTVDELCGKIVEEICNNETKFQSQLNSLALPQLVTREVQSDDDPILFPAVEPDTRTFSRMGFVQATTMDVAQPRNLAQENSYREIMMRAYEHPTIVTVNDPRIASWARFLRRVDTHEEFIPYCMRTNSFCPFEFLLGLNAWECPEDDKPTMKRILEEEVGGCSRIYHDQLETMYMWGPALMDGAAIVAVPDVDVTDPDYTRSPEWRMFTRGMQIFRETLANNIQNLNEEDRGQSIWRNLIANAFSAAGFLTANVPLITGAGLVANGHHRILHGSPSFTAMRMLHRARQRGENVWTQRAMAVVDVLTMPLSGVLHLFDVAGEYAVILSNKISSAILWAFDWMGIPHGQAMDTILRSIVEVGFTTLIIAMTPLVVSLGYIIVRYLYKLIYGDEVEERTNEVSETEIVTKEAEKYESSPRLLKPHGKATRVVVSRQRQSTNQNNNINWTDQKVRCPFCDSDALKNEGEFIIDDGYFAKKNIVTAGSFDASWVIAPADHDRHGNPLLDKEAFVEEFTRLMIFKNHLDDGTHLGKAYRIERNYGLFSGGAIHHPHMQIHFGLKNFSLKRRPQEAGLFSVDTVKNVVGNVTYRSVVIQFGGPENTETLEDVYDLLQPLIDGMKPGSFNINIDVGDAVMVGSIVLLSARIADSNDEQLLTKKILQNLKSYLTQIKLQSPIRPKPAAALICGLASNEIEYYGDRLEMLQSIGTPETNLPQKSTEREYREQAELNLKTNFERNRIEQSKRKEEVRTTEMQGIDDASVALMKGLTQKHQVLLTRGYPDNPTPEQYSRFNSFEGRILAGVAFGRECVFPSHMAKTGELIKLRFLGTNSINEVRSELLAAQYTVLKVLYHDERRDLAYSVFLSREQAESYLEEKTGQKILLSGALRQPQAYSSGFERHLNTDQTAIKILDGIFAIQWLPMVGVMTAAHATFRESQAVRFRNLSDGTVEIRDWIEVNGIHVTANATQSGDCGGLLLVQSPRVNAKVLGFHIAGDARIANSALLTLDWLECARGFREATKESAPCALASTADIHGDFVGGLGHLQISDWPEIQWAHEGEDVFGELIVEGIMEDLPDGDAIRPVGVVFEKNEPANLHKGISSWEKSPFYGAFDVELVPGPLDPTDDRIEKVLPLNASGRPSLLKGPMSEACTTLPDIDLKLIWECHEQLLREAVIKINGAKIGLGNRNEDQIIDEAMNGRPNWQAMTGMEVNSSAGYPWTTHGKTGMKSDLISVDEKTGKRSFSTEGALLKAMLHRKLTLARQKRRMTSFCSNKLKNCLIKMKKVREGRTRVFNCGSVEDIIASNALFAPFKEAYITGRETFNHAIGTDPHSISWTILKDHLDKFPNPLDIDFRNYDKHMNSLLMRLAYRYIIRLIEIVDPDDWSDARYTIAEADITSLMLDFFTVYQTEHANKSGAAMTTIINCLVNELQLFYVYSKLTGKVDLSDFRENVAYLLFGDDIVATVSNKMAKIFNFPIIQRELLLLGQEATTAKKDDGEPQPFGEWDDITFLKRRFKFYQGRYIAPLEKASIEATFGWSEVTADRVGVWTEIVKTQAMEAALWGEEYYNRFCNRLTEKLTQRRMDAALRNNIAPYLSVSWKQQMDTHMLRLGIREVMNQSLENDETSFGKWLNDNNYTLFEGLSALNLNGLGSQLALVQSEVDRIDGILQRQGQTIGEIQARVNTIQGEVTSMREDVETAKVQAQEAITIANKVETQLAALETKVDEAVSDASNALEQAKGATKDAQEAKQGLAELKGQVETDIKKIKDQQLIDQAAIETNSNNITYLDSQINQFGTRLNQLAERIDETESDFEKLKSEFNDFKTDLEPRFKTLEEQTEKVASDLNLLSIRVDNDIDRIDNHVEDIVGNMVMKRTRYNAQYQASGYFSENPRDVFTLVSGTAGPTIGANRLEIFGEFLAQE